VLKGRLWTSFLFRWAPGKALEFLLGIYVSIITRYQMSGPLQLITTAIAVFLNFEAGSIRLPGVARVLYSDSCLPVTVTCESDVI
jgi:hypothetical protein